MNIVRMIIAFPEGDKFPVGPMLRPTVPKAEAVSNESSRKAPRCAGCAADPSSLYCSSKPMASRKTIEREASVIASVTERPEIVRLRNSGSRLPRSLAHAVRKMTAAAVVLIPPAAEPGEPPMRARAWRWRGCSSPRC